MNAYASGSKLSGLNLPGIAGFSPADMSDFGLDVAAMIRSMVTSAFDPRDSRDVYASSPVSIMLDKARDVARWSAEIGTDNPSLQANALFNNETWATFPPATGFRSSLFSQHTDYAVFGVCYVSAAQLQLAATRTLYSKNPGGGDYVSLVMNSGTNHLQVNTNAAGAVEGHDTGFAPTVGVHVFCVSQRGNTIEVFWDGATTPIFSQTLGGTPTAISGRWTVGCLTDPTNASWDAPIGPVYFMDGASLHGGSSDLDLRRTAIFKSAADHYGIVLTS